MAGHHALSREPQKTGLPGTGGTRPKQISEHRAHKPMPDDISPDVNDLDLQGHVEEIVAFFLQIGVSPEQAADCISAMVLDCYELYGTRH